MAKNCRPISVGDTKYRWVVRTKNVDLVHVGIWVPDHPGQKLNVKLNYDDPWLNYGPIITCKDPDKIRKAFNTKPIMPKEVKAIIEKALEFGWQPKEKAAELYLVWNRNLEKFDKLSAEEYKSLKTFY